MLLMVYQSEGKPMEAEELKRLIGSRIALVRKAAGLSQTELGEKIGANKQTVSRWERGLRAPDGEYLRAITDICGCSADFLLGRSDTFKLRQ